MAQLRTKVSHALNERDKRVSNENKTQNNGPTYARGENPTIETLTLTFEILVKIVFLKEYVAFRFSCGNRLISMY